MDRRRFKRYRKRHPMELTVKGMRFKASTIDYSFGGIGILCDDSPDIKTGDDINLRVEGISMQANGKVAWHSKTQNGLRLGFSKLDNFKGSLKDFWLSDLLIGFQRSLLTGTLTIKNKGIRKDIFIKKGDMIFASSNLEEDRLGDILLREGRIDKEQFDRSSMLIRETGKRQGAILVECGFIKPAELITAVNHQVENIILSLFELTEGDFDFKKGPPSDEVITLRLSAGNLIYRGIKRVRNMRYIEGLLDLTMNATLCFSPNPLNLFQNIRFDEEDKKILSFIDGKTSLKAISAMSGLDERTALRVSAALLGTGILEFVEEGVVQIDISPEEVTEEQKTSPGLLKKIEDMYKLYESLDYYEVLGVKAHSPDAEIRRAFYRLAKEFHPDRHFSLKDDVKGKLHSLFSYITNAYSTLSNPQKRQQYDSSLNKRPEKKVSSEELAAGKFREGRDEFRAGRFDEASRLFSEAAYLDAAKMEYHYYQGLCLLKSGKIKDAERALSRALRHDPSNPDVLSELGHIFLSLGFPLRAKGNFTKALSIDPSNKRAKEGMEMVENA
jgi:tetratricopeptide (TPR) repeat protein